MVYIPVLNFLHKYMVYNPVWSSPIQWNFPISFECFRPENHSRRIKDVAKKYIGNVTKTKSLNMFIL